jgi:Heterokaryon incompatibility protein (HET)
MAVISYASYKDVLVQQQKASKSQSVVQPTPMTSNFHPLPSTLARHSELCARCQKLDLNALCARRGPYLFPQGAHILDLGATAEDLRASPCSLCRIFASIIPPKSRLAISSSTPHYHLRVLPYSDIRSAGSLGRPRHDSRNSALIVVTQIDRNRLNNTADLAAVLDAAASLEETGLLSLRHMYRPQRPCVTVIDPLKFNADFAINSLNECRSHHKRCKVETPKHSLKYFKLLDCKTLQVVDSKFDEEYLALSYVWGPPSQGQPDHEPLGKAKTTSVFLNGAPKAVLDAIEVVFILGLRYLWVDRYCIDQFDAIEKHHQIAHMDLIYSRAVLTIVAAAGADPDYGLPGINGTSRSYQANLQVDNHSIIGTLQDPQVTLNKTTWITRGWTFQEYILSPRRLIFTDVQVLYECQEMHRTEVRTHRTSPTPTPIKEGTRRGPGPRFVLKNPQNGKPEAIMTYISEFGKRQLTYPSDAINAMMGIFRVFEKNPEPVNFIHGIPIFCVPELGTWCPLRGFIRGLSWYRKVPGHRRTEFSSWTWAGWTGYAEPSLLVPSGLWEREVTPCVSFRCRDRQIGEYNLSELTNGEDLISFLSTAEPLPTTIQISASTCVIPPSAIIQDKGDPQDVTIVFNKSKIRLRAQLYLDSSPDLANQLDPTFTSKCISTQDQDWLALVLQNCRVAPDKYFVVALLLQPGLRSSEDWERIGIMTFSLRDNPPDEFGWRDNCLLGFDQLLRKITVNIG